MGNFSANTQCLDDASDELKELYVRHVVEFNSKL